MKNRVTTSIESLYRDLCVDIFVRPDGTFGFEEFRRDQEDNRQWRCLNRFSHQTFSDEALALSAAKASVPWLAKREIPS